MNVILNLPIPPSVNKLYRNAGKSRVSTVKYTKWLTDAGWWLQSQRPKRMHGWYELSLYLPVKVPGDIDNRLKALSDLLVKHAVIEDDSLAWAVHAIRDHRVEGECQAVLRPVSDAERGA